MSFHVRGNYAANLRRFYEVGTVKIDTEEIEVEIAV
jgi:hypothetical protein